MINKEKLAIFHCTKALLAIAIKAHEKSGVAYWQETIEDSSHGRVRLIHFKGLATSCSEHGYEHSIGAAWALNGRVIDKCCMYGYVLYSS